MTLTTNAKFQSLLDQLRGMGDKALRSHTTDAIYQEFVQKFPANNLETLSLDSYCVGKGIDDSFCRWLERGLEPVMGRYMPGTSRGHILYFAKDGTVYKHGRLKDLSDEDALRYTLKVQAAIAGADPAADLRWIDDDEQIYARAELKTPRVTVGEGRKLRLLAAYHPDQVLPFSSTEHVAHFLKLLGCPTADIPRRHQAVARMLKLWDYFVEARKFVLGLTPLGFMDGLYAEGLGLAPSKDVEEVLSHFSAVPDLAAQLKKANQTEAFCQLALGLHEGGLDWWITEAKIIHAGRMEDPKVWTAVVALELELQAQGIQVRLKDEPACLLDDEAAARVADAAQADERVSKLEHRDANWPDEFDGPGRALVIRLTANAVNNGQIKTPKLQRLFPKECIAKRDSAPLDSFKLVLPDGSEIASYLLARDGLIQHNFRDVFSALGVQKHDHAALNKDADGRYRLSLSRNGVALHSVAPPPHSPQTKDVSPMSTQPLNQILFGPPGTGKTYATVNAALEILDPALLKSQSFGAVPQSEQEQRAKLKARFDALVNSGHIRFVTFHQSFSYEDFVEGIRASTPTDDGEIASAVSYAVEPGVFVELCRVAKRNRQLDKSLGVREGAKVWKLSIEEASGPGETRKYCLAHSEARIGWPKTGDLNVTDLDNPKLKLGSNERHALRDFGQNITPGDVVVCLASKTTISAVGVVTGEYEYTEKVPAGVRSDYVHKLPVNWLATGLDFNILALNQGKQLTLKAVYHLWRIQWPELQQGLNAAGVAVSKTVDAGGTVAEPHVLIIDEINRGNISRIFGELITLIEPSKRDGADEALEVTLPYSKKPFSVPSNVHLIGTMNTADRSLAGLDVALRRRFVFKEMLPQPQMLAGVVVGRVNLEALLTVINQRIEALLDREHCIGHAYFMPLQTDKTINKLAEIFKNQVLPLLQEYFFDDWQRIQWVLNDHRKAEKNHQFIQAEQLNTSTLFGGSVNVSHRSQTWKINGDAFLLEQSYLGVLNPTAVA